ncbi:unnamed protein product [Diplocarpon coronariae]
MRLDPGGASGKRLHAQSLGREGRRDGSRGSFLRMQADVDEVALLVDVLLDFPVERRIADSGHTANAMSNCSPLGSGEKLSRHGKHWE